MIWNVPEDAEKQFPPCEALVKNILFDFMGMNADVEIMRAHRTTIQNCCGGMKQARPIHVALLRFTDKQYICSKDAAKLRDHPFQEANLFISDDVSRKVRKDQKKLKENYLEAGPIELAQGSSNARGVGILFQDGSDCKISKKGEVSRLRGKN